MPLEVTYQISSGDNQDTDGRFYHQLIRINDSQYQTHTQLS